MIEEEERIANRKRLADAPINFAEHDLDGEWCNPNDSGMAFTFDRFSRKLTTLSS
jgi:hypothetical protein